MADAAHAGPVARGRVPADRRLQRRPVRRGRHPHAVGRGGGPRGGPRPAPRRPLGAAAPRRPGPPHAVEAAHGRQRVLADPARGRGRRALRPGREHGLSFEEEDMLS
ncbi:hypothetical protein B9W68_14545 [Streptomyces sp. CS227]|nr:hypothetical protein B9W68_14545 [Streptomyces sp. CS227]